MKKPKTRFQLPQQRFIGCLCSVFGGGIRDGNYKLVRYNKGAWAPWVVENIQTGRLHNRFQWDIQVDTWTHPIFRKPDPDPEYESLLV